MRWFKHIAVASNDEIMSELMDEFGAEGYGIWWIILEKIAQTMDKSNCCSARFSLKVWSTSCRVSPKKFQKLVKFLENKKVFSLKFDENYIEVECSNLLKYRDEYSKKKTESSGQTPESVRILSGVCPEQDTEDRRQNIDIEKKKVKKEKYERKHKLPDEFCVTDKHREMAAKKGWPAPESQIDKFKNHHQSKGNKGVDWDKAFYVWLDNAKDFNQPRGNNHAINQRSAPKSKSHELWTELATDLVRGTEFEHMYPDKT